MAAESSWGHSPGTGLGSFSASQRGYFEFLALLPTQDGIKESQKKLVV